MADQQTKTTTNKPVKRKGGATPENKKAMMRAIKLKAQYPTMTVAEIAKIVDRDPSNIRKVLKKYGIDTKRVERFKEIRADILAGYQEKIISGISADDIEDATLMQKVTAFGILFDKERVERGQASQYIAMAHLCQEVDKEEELKRNPVSPSIIEVEAIEDVKEVE